MNIVTENFIKELTSRQDVLGIILFGSWARGNNRSDSDVDLIVIVTHEYKRAVEHKYGQVFEVIYTTAKSAFEFWDDNRDDAADLWSVAKILFDKDGSVEHLRVKVEQMLKLGKAPIDESLLGQWRFDAEDHIYYAETVSAQDLTTANMMLFSKVYSLTQQFFDIRRVWVPAPKQRMAEIRLQNPEFYILVEQFYSAGASFDDRLSLARKMIAVVFQ